MATLTFANQNTDWASTSNWGGAAPATGDTVRIFQGDVELTGSMAQSGVNLAELNIGPGFRGRLGSPGDPLYIDADLIRINAPYAKSINIRPVSCPAMYVDGANIADAGVFLHSGTVTKLYVSAAGMLRIGAATISELIGARSQDTPGSDLNISVEAGATLTTVRLRNSYFRTLSTVGTSLLIDGSTVDFRAASATLAALTMQGASLFKWNGNGSTITLATIYGGLFDAREILDPRTLTNSEVWAGAIMNLGGSACNITVSNNVKRFGGRIFGTNAITNYIEEASSLGFSTGA